MSDPIPQNCTWVGGVSPADLPAQKAPSGRLRSILLTACRWFRQKLDFRDGVFKRREGVPVHPEMGNHSGILPDIRAYSHEAHCVQGQVANAVVMANPCNLVEKYDRGVRAGEGRYASGLTRNQLGDDWRLFTGFIGHDGVSRFFNPLSGAWDLTAPFGRAKAESAKASSGATP